MNLRAHHPLKGERNFTWRGGDPTRVEALSDMVFAFALTLLVVSVDPPRTFTELSAQLWGFPGFAAAFSVLLIIWHGHYIFFRRYNLSDGWTTTLNAGLLFLILFFVYPLKYMATMLSHFLQTVAAGAPAPPLTLEEARYALILMGLGYAAVFLVFALLYARARSRADALQLDAKERALSRFSFWEQVAQLCTGLAVAIAAALLPLQLAPLSGFIFCLIGPCLFAISPLANPPRPKRAATA
jgi:uncharacterized membrane protein